MRSYLFLGESDAYIGENTTFDLPFLWLVWEPPVFFWYEPTPSRGSFHGELCPIGADKKKIFPPPKTCILEMIPQG